jgi:hypothetical protein
MWLAPQYRARSKSQHHRSQQLQAPRPPGTQTGGRDPHHARVTAAKTRRATKANKRAQGSFGYLISPPPAMYPALRSLPSCAPINRDHAREDERKSDFCFEVGNETRNPRRRGHVPIKCCGVACAQVAKKPNHKPGYVNCPADTFRFCHPIQPRSSNAGEGHRLRRSERMKFFMPVFVPSHRKSLVSGQLLRA